MNTQGKGQDSRYVTLQYSALSFGRMDPTDREI